MTMIKNKTQVQMIFECSTLRLRLVLENGQPKVL